MPFYFYFLLTLLLEMPIVLWFFKKQWKLALPIGILLNLFTWPLLHLLLQQTTIGVNWLELGVFIVEGLGYWIFLQCGWKKGLGVALLANGFSYGAGILINMYLL